MSILCRCPLFPESGLTGSTVIELLTHEVPISPSVHLCNVELVCVVCFKSQTVNTIGLHPSHVYRFTFKHKVGVSQ